MGHSSPLARYTGRPTTLTEEILTAFCEYREEGLTVKDALALLFVPSTTYARWLEMGEQDDERHELHRAFLDCSRRSAAIYRARMTRIASACTEDSPHALRILERRDSEHWRQKKEIEHRGAVPIKQYIIEPPPLEPEPDPQP
jgi:hypothetical protein